MRCWWTIGREILENEWGIDFPGFILNRTVRQDLVKGVRLQQRSGKGNREPCIFLGKWVQAEETRRWKRPEVGIVWCVLAQSKREACPRGKVTLDTVRSCALDTVRSCALHTEGGSERFWTHKRHGLNYILPRSLWGYIQENNTASNSGCLHSASYVTRISNY